MGVAVAEKPVSPETGFSSRVPRLFRPLLERDIALLWTGQTISLIGDSVYFLALAWLTLQLTGSPLALGGILIAAAIPRGVLMLGGGAVSDRFSPRLVMLSSDTVRAVIVAVIAVLVLSGNAHLWYLYILAVLFGAIDALFYPSAGAILPTLTDAERLPAATALTELSARASTLVGPILAGVIIASFGLMTGSGIAFTVDALTFVVSAVTLAFIRGGARRTASHAEEAPETGAEEGIFSSIRAGLLYAWHDSVIRYLLLIVAGIDVTLNGAFAVGLPVLVRDHLSGGAAALGTLDSAFGAGAVIGIVIAGSLRTPPRKGLLAVGITTGFGVGVALLGVTPNLIAATLCMGAMAIGSGLATVLIVPWLQTRTDPSMLGRVMSMFMLASLGLTPLSYAAAGWIASINYSLVFFIGGAIVLATATFALLNPTIRTIN